METAAAESEHQGAAGRIAHLFASAMYVENDSQQTTEV